jgi:hypothetical protein
MLTEQELKEIELRCMKAQAGPWKAYIEGRDHESGSDIIKTGEEDKRGEDIELTGATEADYDFIAHARQDIPKLIEEIRRLKSREEH